MRKHIFIIIFLLFIQKIYSQEYGIAVEDKGFAAKINPSAIGAGNASGISYYQKITDSGSFSDIYSLYFTASPFSYGFDSVEGLETGKTDIYHQASLGFPLTDGLYGGLALRWKDSAFKERETSLSALFRPWNFLSLGVAAWDPIGDNTITSIGAGLRPFAINSFWGNRITFFIDAEIENKFDFTRAGISAEPFDGIRFQTSYDIKQNSYTAGINISSRYLSTGANSYISRTGETAGGSISGFVSLKRLRSADSKVLPGVMVEYDNANIIRDYPQEFFLTAKLFSGQTYRENSLYQFLTDMEKIKNDPDIDALLFRNQSFRTSFANIVEISKALDEIRNAGKKIYFYYDSVSTLPYALAASSADSIFIAPSGSVDLKGFSKTNLYMKDFLEKFGIALYNFKSHEYKTAYDAFSESAMSDSEREALEYLYNSLQEQLEIMIEKGRGDRIQNGIGAVIDKGPLIYSSRALSEGLVDRLMYRDEFLSWIKQNRYRMVKYSSFPEKAEYDWNYTFQPVIAVIYASGNIVRGTGIKGEAIGSESIAAALRSARENPLVKGIVIRIDSGGGSALASDLIAREIALCRPKPVVVTMGGAAASGGYYIAVPAEQIFANPVTVTGSIGVITIIPDFSGLLQLLSIKEDTVKTSESSDFGNIARPMTEMEIEKVRTYISEIYDQFISAVAENRNIDRELVHENAQGRIWTGLQAKDRGLVDQTGGMADSISYMEDKYNDGKSFRIMEIVPGRTFFSIRNYVPFMKSRSRENQVFPESVREILDFLVKAEADYSRGEPLFLLPYTMEELGLVNNEEIDGLR